MVCHFSPVGVADGRTRLGLNRNLRKGVEVFHCTEVLEVGDNLVGLGQNRRTVLAAGGNRIVAEVVHGSLAHTPQGLYMEVQQGLKEKRQTSSMKVNHYYYDYDTKKCINNYKLIFDV